MYVCWSKLSVRLPVCSVCPSVRPFRRLSVCPHVRVILCCDCPPARLFRLSVRLSVWLSVWLSICQCVPHVRLFFLSDCPSAGLVGLFRHPARLFRLFCLFHSVCAVRPVRPVLSVLSGLCALSCPVRICVRSQILGYIYLLLGCFITGMV